MSTTIEFRIPYQVNNNSICTIHIDPMKSWGDAIKQASHESDRITTDCRLVVSRKTLGYDINLYDPIACDRDHVTVYVLYLGPYQLKVMHPYMVWLRGDPWPPCSNYIDDVEPLNMLPIGRYTSKNDKHCCETCDERSGQYKKMNDNNPQNIIVLVSEYGGRIGFNMFGLQHWLSTHNTDPMTNKVFTQQTITDINEARGNYETINVHYISN